MPESDEVVPGDEEAKMAKKASEIAMASLTMAFKTEAMINIIFRTMTTKWPGGLAHKVISELKRQFQPDDILCRVELRHSLNAIKMKKGQDPANLFEQVYSIQNRSKVEIPEEDFVAVVLDAASDEYQAVLTSERARLKENLNVSDLEDVMRSHWRSISTKSNSKAESDDEAKEITLASISFGGTCFLCKKKGHRIKDCLDKKENSSGANSSTGTKFNGKCNNCGKQGHKGADCWEKPENASKRTKNWKNREISAADISVGADSPVEFIMAGVSKDILPPDGFPDHVDLLKHLDIGWQIQLLQLTTQATEQV